MQGTCICTSTQRLDELSEGYPWSGGICPLHLECCRQALRRRAGAGSKSALKTASQGSGNKPVRLRGAAITEQTMEAQSRTRAKGTAEARRARAAETDREAARQIALEIEARNAKTARLKAARLAKQTNVAG